MSISQQSSSPGEEHPALSWSLDAVLEGGPGRLAELLGDVGYLLSTIATDPRVLVESNTLERRVVTHLVGNLHTARSALDALEAHAVVALAEVTHRDHVAAARDRAAQEEAAVPAEGKLAKAAEAITRRDLSLITRRSPSVAGSALASSRRLIGSLPRMLSALSAGRVTSQVAHGVAQAVAPLEESQRREVDSILHEHLPELDAAGVKQWRREVAAIVQGLDPAGAARRHRTARTHQHLSFTPGENGMATISAHLPAIDARLVHKRLSLEAERRLVHGEKGGHGALMVDALTDTILGREAGMDPVTLDIGVIITDRALFDPDRGDAAQIEGYGPVPPGAVREQLRASTATPPDPEQDPFGPDGPAVRAVIRRLYTHPTSGELVAVESRARAFPPAMGRFLTWRDTSCRGPFCNASIRQHDHITPHSRGGPTSVGNGQGICAHCNQKELDTLAVERLDDPERPGSRVAWTGHSGITRITTPSPLVHPIHREAAVGDDSSAGGPAEDYRGSNSNTSTSSNTDTDDGIGIGTDIDIDSDIDSGTATGTATSRAAGDSGDAEGTRTISGTTPPPRAAPESSRAVREVLHREIDEILGSTRRRSA